MAERAFLPHLAYDSVVFGFSGDELKILIMEYHNTGLFALPGGFVGVNEDLDMAVRRGLGERTGLTDIYLEQFHTFGSMARYKPEVMATILRANGHDTERELAWLLDRFVSVGYYALINYKDVVPKPDALSDSCQWYPVKELPKLILDHEDIVNKAVLTLRQNLDRKLVGGNLLPQRFTMKELQQVYEAILDTKLDRRNFRKKFFSMDFLIDTGEYENDVPHRPGKLYQFNFQKYEQTKRKLTGIDF